MAAADARDRTEATKPIGHDARCWRQVRPRHRLDVFAVVRLDDVEQEPPRVTVVTGLDGRNSVFEIETGPNGTRPPSKAWISRLLRATSIVHVGSPGLEGSMPPCWSESSA